MSAADLYPWLAITVSALSPLAVVFFQHRLSRENRRAINVNRKAIAETSIKLDEIHVLVNGNLTNAEERELVATRSHLASMWEVVRLKEDRGVAIDPKTAEAIKVAEDRIHELALGLVHKLEQQAQLEQQQAAR